MTDPPQGREGLEGARRAGAAWIGLGMTWALSILLFLWAGWWLDGRLGIRPVLTIAGAALGAFGGFWYILKEVMFRPRRELRK